MQLVRRFGSSVRTFFTMGNLVQLGPMKQDCQTRCFSTLNHIVAYCYNDARVIRWLVKQALNRFQG